MRLLLAVLMVAWSSPIFAQTVQVRAADHDTFSRIVFYGQSEKKWGLRKTEGGYFLRKSGGDFDLSQVFERMTKERITDLVEIQGGILLRTDCDCHANAFFLAPDMVVIDVNDGPGTDLGIRSFPLTKQQAAGLQAGLSQPATRKEVLDLGVLDRTTEVSDVVSVAEALLLEQLGRAATQGLASPKNKTEDPLDVQITPMTPRKPSVKSDVLSASTSIDVFDAEEAEVSSTEHTCAPDDWFPSEEWSQGTSFSSGLGRLRSELSDETGAISQERTLQLARHYVAHGFTLEASLLVAENSSDEADFLKQIIDIIDMHYDAPAWPASAKDCVGPAAVWQFLSSSEDRASEDLEAQLLQALPQLPPDLARIIVPRIVEFAELAGREDFAFNVATQLGYILGTPDRLVRTGRGASGSSVSAESAALLKLARSAENTSPRALLSYVHLQFGNQMPIAADIPDLVDAYAFELKGTEAGKEFGRAKLMISALSGDFASMWPSLEETFADEDLISGSYTLLLRNATDIQFLRYGTKIRGELKPELRLEFSKRFHDLGFQDLAIDWLPDDTKPETSLLRARIFVSKNQLPEALAQLDGAIGKEATRLKAEIKISQKSYAPAARDFLKAEAQSPALRAAFLSNDQALIAEIWEDDFADAMGVDLPVPTTGQTTLSESRNLITATKAKSSAFAAALNAFSAP